MADSIPGMRTRRLIDELRRDNDRREREAELREREAELRERESAARIAEMRREGAEASAEHRRRMERIDAAMAKSDEDHRVMMAEMRAHSQRMRVGFEVLFGSFADLRKDLGDWRDEGGSSAAT